MSALNVDAVEHAEDCPGTPLFEQDGVGHWTARCSAAPRYCTAGWEVTGCETRAEAGAAFYGHDPRGN